MYFFCSQITATTNKIEKSSQRDLNFIFYEVSEYFNFFCLETLPLEKKLLMNINFVKTKLHVNVIHEKLWGIHVSSNNIVANVFATVTII